MVSQMKGEEELIHKNGEGYPDPTASEAISEVDKPPERVMTAIRRIKTVADSYGFEVSGRIWLRDKTTGREYR